MERYIFLQQKAKDLGGVYEPEEKGKLKAAFKIGLNKKLGVDVEKRRVVAGEEGGTQSFPASGEKPT